MSGFTQFLGAVAGQVTTKVILDKIASASLGQREPRPYDLPVIIPGSPEVETSTQAGPGRFTVPTWLFLTGYGALLWYAAKATTPTVDLPDLGEGDLAATQRDLFDPGQGEDLLFPGLKRELTHLDVEDSATSDDPVEACLERAGWKLERVDELRETIFEKEQVDLFTEPDPLTRSEGELLEAIETCMQRLESQYGSLEAAGVGCSVCDGDDPDLLAGIVPLEYSISIENAVKELIQEGVKETHYLVSLSPIRTLVTPLQPAKGFPYVKITAQGNVTSYDSKGKSVAVPQQMTFLGATKGKPRIIVLARMEMTGSRPTGKVIQRDRNFYPEMEEFAEPHALMYIKRERKGDFEKAQIFAAEEGYQVIVYPAGTKKPLEKAKADIEAGYKGKPPEQMTFLGGGDPDLAAVQREMFDPEQEELTLYPGPTAPKHMQAKEGPDIFWFFIAKGFRKAGLVTQEQIDANPDWYFFAEKHNKGKLYQIEADTKVKALRKLHDQLQAAREYKKEYGQKQNKFTPWFHSIEDGGKGYRIIPNIMAHPGGSLEAAGDDPNLGAVASAHKPPDYDAVKYWDFDNTKVLPLVYRGITDEEAASIAGTGRILSTMEFSHGSEGTSFAQDYYTAESTVNYGRTDPKKTGKPTYVLEIKRGAEMNVDPRDYFVKAKKPIPASRIKRAWKYNPDGTIEAVELSQGKWTTLASGNEADFLSGLGAVQREMFDPEQIEMALPIAHKTVEEISSLYEYLDTLEPGEPANILDACNWILGSENCGAAQTDHPAGGVETVIHLVKHEGYYFLDDLRKAYKSGDKASIPQHRKTRYLGIAS